MDTSARLPARMGYGGRQDRPMDKNSKPTKQGMNTPKIKTTPRPDTYCHNPACGKRISPGRNERRQYCNTACKQAAYRARHIVTSTNGKRNTTVTETTAQV